ncbi:MAG TPA: hypothetical protein DDZ68_00415 [Parvularcula sp.]|nr:hypothetical protein [Parvularcula sp.]HBS31190.1 hypothetical protein [Parvularcula sp.]HBS35000.1 hypothetical protein [Parvularcula sp.]
MPSDSARQTELDPRLLEILVCPQTKGPLVYKREAGELVSKKARLAFPIRDGIPIMLIEEARALSDEEMTALG